jgi:hypothetical protein
MNCSADTDRLSEEATEVVEIINEIATDLMFRAYDYLPVGGRIKLSELAKNTRRVLEEGQ